MITESAYLELLGNCQKFNSQLSAERRVRLPFLDAHTGIAQNSSQLWRSKRDRREGHDVNVVFFYPARRWRKKRHTVVLAAPDVRYMRSNDTSDQQSSSLSARPEVPLEVRESADAHSHTIKESWPEDISDIADDFEDFEDEDDYEDSSSKRRKKKKVGVKAAKKASVVEEFDRPYSCDVCGMRYKTKPGLSYHKQHCRGGGAGGEAGDSLTSVGSAGPPKEDLGQAQMQPTAIVFCDFCLGDANQNKRTNLPEELISCSDCGRAGHPSCLQFTANMITSTRKYGWQCIECKSCAICGTSENDDQLLFCDDCDRGYHMYCLKPPLSEPPEGSWSCDLCRQEFGTAASAGSGMSPPQEHNFPRNLKTKETK